MKYESFIDEKSQLGGNFGFKPIYMPDFLFDFQQAILEWAVLKGKSAVFADCGLGKTPMQLIWAENIVRKTNGRVLILTPLAVAMQTVKEAAKFGIEAIRSSNGKYPANAKIIVTNYEQLHKFNPEDFEGVACDESSILKNFDGVRRSEITTFMRKVKYRSLWTATAAPNDYTELGTSSEALGCLGHMDMLGKFFKNDLNNCATSKRGRFNEATKWRFKGHAEIPFWKWICSWGRALRRPSDLGFDDSKFVLPPLIETQHVVKSSILADGYLFALPAYGLKEQRDERRRSVKERCEKMAQIADTKEPIFIACNLNDEADLLEEMIPHSVQVSGSDCDELKEERFTAFAAGKIRAFISKPKITAWGLNFQHCAHVASFPSNSYEQYYQFVRRCWRFGQKRRVKSDIVASEGELSILKNLQRKAGQADKMFSALVQEMNNATSINSLYKPKTKEKLPLWL